LISLQKT